MRQHRGIGWKTTHLAPLLLVGAMLPLGCGGMPPAPLTVSPHLEAEVDRSIEIREANGLRADHDWVLRVVTDPRSVRRYGILVTTDEAHDIDEHSVAKAIALRASIGMRADEVWVRAITFDPRAVIRYGISMTSDEAATFDRRITTQSKVVPAVVDYGEDFPAEWAGAYIDTKTSDVVAQFTGHVEEHRAALLALFAPGLVTIDVHQANYSTAELDALNAPIWTDAAQEWLKDQGVRVVGGGSRVIENDVNLEVSVPQPDPTLVQRIVDHFQGAGWLTVVVRVAPAPPTVFGNLRVWSVDIAGKPLVGVACWLHPDIDGYAGDDAVRLTDQNGECRWERIGATGYRVEIWQRVNEGLLGAGRVVVPANGTAQLRIVVISQR